MINNEVKAADRGCIYEFIEQDGTIKNKVLVVSSQKRAYDNIVSVLMLGTRYTGSDAVKIKIDGAIWCVHCGLVTYARRQRLGRMLGKVADKTMEQIDNGMAFQLGLNSDQNNYKQLYEELLERILG